MYFENIFNNLIYWLCFFLMTVGFYGIIIKSNYIKKLISLTIFQISVLLIYIASSYVENSSAPILNNASVRYTNPIPHVLMLTAIVVGVATLCLGLSICIRINKEFNSVEEDEIEQELEKLD
jgi:multicomponent Na+:H+ antiporter subunit C